MKYNITTIGIGVSICLAAFFMGAKSDNSISQDSLGIVKSGLDDTNALSNKGYSYQGSEPMPGDTNKRIARAYDNAPPMIPHDISAFGEITAESNACIGCHMPEAAKAVGAIPVPKTHLTNLRTGQDLKGELYEGRYNCTQCHAPQAKLDPVVNNRFKGAFRAKTGGEYKSNLSDTIREGVIENTEGSFDVNKDLDLKAE